MRQQDVQPRYTIPLSGWADRELARLATETGSAAIAGLSGAQLLGERAALNRFHIPGMVSAGGGCRLLPAREGWIALNLARGGDRALLPALLADSFDPDDDAALAARIAATDAEALVARGREMGLAIARTGERPVSGAVAVIAETAHRAPQHRPPLVLDLSALWAGPLAGHLLWLAGAEVLKIENPRRPDTMREGDPALFARLNQGKASVALDIATPQGRTALLALVAQADIIVEAARPRALAQFGIDAAALLARRPTDRPLIWLSITGHGAEAPAADWVGFGDDCGVAGGLTDALIDAGGQPGFVGDAIADPLAGITAARAGWRAWRLGASTRIGIAMSGVVAEALAEERAHDAAGLAAQLRAWSIGAGTPFPALPPRTLTGDLRPLGADTGSGPC